jgi:hypothetical protein
MREKTKAHIRYKNANGEIVPGVTTVLGILNKPALVKWANNLGLQGIDSSRYRDEMADVGTLAHYLVMCELTGQTPVTADYSPNQLEMAENATLSYYEWAKGHTIEPILVEEALVSDQYGYGYGGTVDLYAAVDGVKTLVDFKTGKAIYPEMVYQLAAYKHLLLSNGYELAQARILRIGRDADEGFEEKVVNGLEREWAIFAHCLGIYNLRKAIKKGGN